MDRVVVTGNSCGGKSTLARRLAAELDLPYVELDGVVFPGGSAFVGDDAFHARHAELIAGDRWLLDGIGLPLSLPPRLERATAIVLIDLPLWVHFLHAAKRHADWVSGRLEHPPAGIPVAPPLAVLFKFIWDVEEGLMPQLRRGCVRQARAGKTVFRLRTVPACNAFTGGMMAARHRSKMLMGQELEV